MLGSDGLHFAMRQSRDPTWNEGGMNYQANEGGYSGPLAWSEPHGLLGFTLVQRSNAEQSYGDGALRVEG